METGEVGGHIAAAAKPVEEGLTRDIEVAITQAQWMEDSTALDLLHKLRLAVPMDVQVCIIVFSKSKIRRQLINMHV